MPDEPTRSDPEEGIPRADESTQHWFAGKDVDTLLYKINRRPPITGETLFSPPENILDHLDQVLASHVAVETGRVTSAYGASATRSLITDAGTLTGMVGWTRSGAALASVWDDDRQEWADRVVAGDVTVVAPFAFDR